MNNFATHPIQGLKMDVDVLKHMSTFVNFKEYKADMMISEAKKLIEKYDLKNKSRGNEYTFNRFVLFEFFTSLGISLQMTASFFNMKCHTSVINGLKQYNEMTETNYSRFIELTRDLQEDLEIIKYL